MSTSKVVSYADALAFMAELKKLHVKFLPETFSMKTSGVYIPSWEKDVPYTWDGTTAKWYFHFRFGGHRAHPDMCVAKAMSYAKHHGMHKLAHEINTYR